MSSKKYIIILAKMYDIEILNPEDSLEEWDSFVDNSPQGCIFCRSWWLKIVCPNSFIIVTLRKGERIIAGLPLPIKKMGGYTIITQPEFTQTLGILLEAPTSEKNEVRLSSEIEHMKIIIKNIPQFTYFSMNFHYNFTNWLPFYWAGYQQTTRYTYVINDLTNLQQFYLGIAHNAKNKIKKAQNVVSVVDTDDIDSFIELSRKTFARQGMNIPFPTRLLKSINHECASRQARKIFIAKDTKNRAHAAVFVVYDQKSMYCLLSGGDPALRESGAGVLLRWHSIEFANKVTEKFDFEGSMMANIEPFVRSFGGLQMPYFNITKDNRSPFLKIGYKMYVSARKALLWN